MRTKFLLSGPLHPYEAICDPFHILFVCRTLSTKRVVSLFNSLKSPNIPLNLSVPFLVPTVELATKIALFYISESDFNSLIFLFFWSLLLFVKLI